MSPDFLTLEEVLEIHDDQINRYGGASGIRDLGLLESALAQPQIIFAYRFVRKAQELKKRRFSPPQI